MAVVSTVTVKVPATTANLGPGFDCLGAALTLYNEFKFTLANQSSPALQIQVTGKEAERVTTDASNLVYKSFVEFYQYLGKTPPAVEIEINLGIALARGLGSSATAIAGGLMGANELAGKPLNQSEIVKLAIAIEGHPDNVVPALIGGCRLAVQSLDNWSICQIPWHQEIIPVVAIPDFELSTEEARSVLPQQISRVDAIFNVSRLGLLLRALEINQPDWLEVALNDTIHQPYRQGLIKGYETLHSAAISAGAYGMVISGAGPTLLALTSPKRQEAVAEAMIAAWQTQGVTAEGMCLSLDTQGAVSS
ncbi:homoserine kinase [Oscillatoria salina]|uniref:homoserine kinase n=1 Tax=Oscillatoria salina TaxID=331517 RepID=UPI0013B9E46C|nr:homoserine kinase [Oscillatoria salina]MBZ8179885.1 homoserine kinase [Oscillatoria salina IIICB1]NET87432.1 homoserine kinase [Kamptonema sp. SIO1D9]